MTSENYARPLRVGIAAGGTGGHIYPGLAVADALRCLTGGTVEVTFFGVAGRLEETLVPQHGYPLHTSTMVGLTGLRGFTLPTRLTVAALTCAREMRRLDLNVVIGMGGYPSAAAVVGAWLARVPLVIHESNAVPGRANAFASLLTRNVAVTFPSAANLFSRRADVRIVGMPLIPSVAAVNRAELGPTARARFGLKPDQKLVVVSGGSLGARRLTEAAVDLAHRWAKRSDVRVIVKTGPAALADVERRLPACSIVTAVGYIDDMDLAYAAADVFVGRSGSATVSELSHIGVPSILVPYPHAPGNHQLHNARSLSDTGAAIVIDDAALTGETLASQLDELFSDPDHLVLMSRNVRKMRRPQAALELAQWACELAPCPIPSYCTVSEVAA